jgi:DNA processing protein
MTKSSDAEQYALSTRERARLGWLALALTPEMGPTRIARAMARLGAAERVFEASLTELEGAGLPARAAQFVFEGRAFEAAEDEAKRVAETGGRSTIRRLRCGFAGTQRCWRGRGLPWWERGSLRHTGWAWRRCWRAISPTGDW